MLLISFFIKKNLYEDFKRFLNVYPLTAQKYSTKILFKHSFSNYLEKVVILRVFISIIIIIIITVFMD